MADISVQKKNGSDLTWVWAAAAVVAIVALMAWLLSTQDQGTTSAAPVESDTAETVVAAEAVELSAVGGAPDQHVGRTLQISEVPVAAQLGDRGFWADVPGANPFLVILGPSVADVSWLAPGASPAVVGTVQPVTEAELDAWVQGSVLQPDARDQAAFATHYLLVSEATP
jgi:hypothetical protein